MTPQRRSDCPLAFALDAVGDRWSLLVLRDILLRGKRHYEEFLESQEGISTNILADRLKRLAGQGLLSKERDAKNRRRYIYRPTEKAWDLLPVIIEMVLWSARYDPDTGAAPDLVERLRNDRAGFLVDVRRRFAGGEGA